MKAATMVWLVTAQLQRDDPEREIPCAAVLGAIARAGWDGPKQSTIQAHVSGHCIATAKPSPDRHRLLTRTRRGYVRLFRIGDAEHPARAGGRILPDIDDVPTEYRYLLRWYQDTYLSAHSAQTELQCSPHGPQQALSLYEKGLDLQEWSRSTGAWKDVDPDEYVRNLREGWGDDTGDASSAKAAVDTGAPSRRMQALLDLRKLAMDSGIWKGVDPDQYIRELRQGWS